MSIIIKGMEMPGDCAMCPMCHRAFDGNETRIACYVKAKWAWEDDGRPDWCPLVEIPTPHGRLIDADAVIDELARAIPYFIDDSVTSAYVEGLGRAKIEIEDAKTVIEAEVTT